MLLDSRILWEKGGYSKDHDFDVAMNRVKKYATDMNFKGVELILADFFIELSKEPAKYMRPENKCDCGCELKNSGTNAIHTLFKRIDLAIEPISQEENDIFTEKLNKLIVAHMEEDNRIYTEKHGPQEKTTYTFELIFLLLFLIFCGLYQYGIINI